MKKLRQLALLAVFQSAVGLSFLRRSHMSRVDTNRNTTAWDMTLAGVAHSPYAANDECSKELGKWWMTADSNDCERHELIPGATVIVEVGGNIGEDLQEFAKNFPSASIFAYEPVPEMYKVLQRKFGANPHVKLAQVGAGSSDRSAALVVGGEHGDLSSHANTSKAFLFGEQINVKLRDVDSLLTDVQRETGKVPDAISIDCEGCEYEVLSRMAQTGWLGKVPFVQVSWHAADKVYRRIGTRCSIEKVLWDLYHPSFHSSGGWQGWKLKSASTSQWWALSLWTRWTQLAIQSLYFLLW